MEEYLLIHRINPMYRRTGEKIFRVSLVINVGLLIPASFGLLAYLFGLCNPMEWVYNVTIVNRTDHAISVTPVGGFRSDKTFREPLDVFHTRCPSIPALHGGDFRLESGSSLSFVYPSDVGFQMTEVVVREPNGGLYQASCDEF